jgi:hypothetical protein
VAKLFAWGGVWGGGFGREKLPVRTCVQHICIVACSSARVCIMSGPISEAATERTEKRCLHEMIDDYFCAVIRNKTHTFMLIFVK